MNRRLSINGKFLSVRPAGVHRTARELVLALDAVLESSHDDAARPDVELVLASDAREVPPLRAISVRTAGPLTGAAWEQLVLPVATLGRTLVNLCNLGPVVRRDAATMIHDLQVRSSPTSYPLAFRLWYRALQPLVAHRHRWILTVSEHSRREIAGYGLRSRERIAVMPNGGDHLERVASDPSVLARCGLEPGRFVLALASVQAHKNVSVLCETFAHPTMADLKLALFGDAGADDFARAGLALPMNAVLTGRLDDAELVALMRAALALAFPSRTEGFGLPVLEAMRLGCPVVSSAGGALSELAGGTLVEADPDDPCAWRQALGRLDDDEVFRERVAAQALTRAARFDWKTSATHLLALLMDERPERAPEERSSISTHATPLRLGVVVATRGRPHEAAALLGHLAAQTLAPERVVFVGVEIDDLPRADPTTGGRISAHDALLSDKGLCAQRNRGLEAILDRVDIVVFFDDDFVPSRHALETVARTFAQAPELVGIEGRVLADGVTCGGIRQAEAERLVAAADRAIEQARGDGRPALDYRVREGVGLYGCNMAFRASAIDGVRFDETLPRYAWQEDVDFANRVGRRGRLARVAGWHGVHRGVTGGRSPGEGLGYSQVANPAYFVARGTMRRRHALRIVAGNLLANHLRAVRQEPWIDRRGRLRGNWRAIADLLAGRLHPSRSTAVDECAG